MPGGVGAGEINEGIEAGKAAEPADAPIGIVGAIANVVLVGEAAGAVEAVALEIDLAEPGKDALILALGGALLAVEPFVVGAAMHLEGAAGFSDGEMVVTHEAVDGVVFEKVADAAQSHPLSRLRSFFKAVFST